MFGEANLPKQPRFSVAKMIKSKFTIANKKVDFTGKMFPNANSVSYILNLMAKNEN